MVSDKQIIEAAEKAGFSSELQAASILRKNGWTVSQNIYFLDKDEQKGRELDIYGYNAISSHDEKNPINNFNFLAVEVKKSKTPWIFFHSQKETVEVGGYSLFLWRHRVNTTIMPYEIIEDKRPGSKENLYARSYCDLSGKTNNIRSAILSAVKAAIHKHENCMEQYSDTSHDYCFFIPVVVVDGDLYNCSLNDSGELISKKVDRIYYRQNYLSENYGEVRSQVDIVSFSGLNSYLKEIDTWQKNVFKGVKNKKHLFKENNQR